MSFTFKDYKINRIALLFIKVLTLSQKQVKIQNSVPSISQTFYSIDRKKWRNSSLSFCLVRLILESYSINRKVHSIGRKEFSIDRNSHNWIFQNFPRTIFDIFIAFFHQKHLLILSMKIYRSNIKVLKIIIKNPNNARNLESIILISLGINFIILALISKGTSCENL